MDVYVHAGLAKLSQYISRLWVHITLLYITYYIVNFQSAHVGLTVQPNMSQSYSGLGLGLQQLYFMCSREHYGKCHLRRNCCSSRPVGQHTHTHRATEGGLAARVIHEGLKHELTEYTCCTVRVMTEDVACIWPLKLQGRRRLTSEGDL